MSFTSSLFLIGLLPWLVILVYLSRNSQYAKQILILMANTLFYAWGGIGAFLFVVVFSVFIWLFSIGLLRYRNKAFLEIIITITVLPLLTTKYIEFILLNINKIAGCELKIATVMIPVGISFFTFEAIALLCDIYTGKITEKISFLHVYLYLTFFPTVTSGPIIRFRDFKNGLYGGISAKNYGSAIERISVGLCKKILIADKIAVLADYYFDGGQKKYIHVRVYGSAL
jgi:D-alanyl-lipoteichoic acid acyltransferase DltB (MBOAT superfamily)